MKNKKNNRMSLGFASCDEEDVDHLGFDNKPVTFNTVSGFRKWLLSKTGGNMESKSSNGV